MSNNPKLDIDAFISYSSKDYIEVNNLRTILESNSISCWMAPQSMPGGASYAQEIPLAIKNCLVFLLMISRQSLSSQWVPKELSIALGQRKTVLPLMLENCALTEIFHFFLTDVQRYNAYESKSEILRLLINRIRQIRENVRHSPVLIPTDNTATENWIINHEPQEVNRLLNQCLSTLRKQYAIKPNAVYIHEWLNNYQIGCNSVLELLDGLTLLNLDLSSAADLYSQIAIIYIHSGDRRYIKKAREYLNRALNILTKKVDFNEAAFKHVIYCRWLIAVTHKQERNFGLACDACEDLIDYIHSERKTFNLPYADSLLLPQRELAIINKEKVMCDYLISRLHDIPVNSSEYFHTVRRLFEYFVLGGEIIKARNLLPELLSAFNSTKSQIDAIYRVALYQILYEYYNYIGEEQRADHYF